MLRSLSITHWELKRIVRSKPSLGLLLALPVALAGATGLVPGIRSHSPQVLGLTVALGWFVLYLRALLDRTTGFADAIDSSPAAGAHLHISRLIVGILVTVLQVLIFCGLVRLLTRHA